MRPEKMDVATLDIGAGGLGIVQKCKGGKWRNVKSESGCLEVFRGGEQSPGEKNGSRRNRGVPQIERFRPTLRHQENQFYDSSLLFFENVNKCDRRSGESPIFKDTEEEPLRSREPQSFGEDVPTPSVSLPTRAEKFYFGFSWERGFRCLHPSVPTLWFSGAKRLYLCEPVTHPYFRRRTWPC